MFGRRPEPSIRLDLRPARPDDLPASTVVWRDGLAEYLGRLNQPDVSPDLEPVRRLLAHLLTTDPDRYWVATRAATSRDDPARLGADDELVVGFASANLRERAWFLSMLFVAPGEQGRGIGAALLERTFPIDVRPHGADGDGDGTKAGAHADASAPAADRAVGPTAQATERADAAGGGEPPWTFATVTDTAQPISNALYARLGLVPRLPVLHLAGHVRQPAALPDLPVGITATPFESLGWERARSAIEPLDRELLGYVHPFDHDFLRREGRIGVLFTRGDSVVAYGYTSRVGRLGPVAVRQPVELPAVVGHLLGVVRPAGVFSIWVPGAAGSTVVALLDAGFRLEPFPALHCHDRPSVDHARYIPGSLALL